MTKIEELAQKTMSHMPTVETEATLVGDPLVTIAIVELVIKLAIVVFDCFKSVPSKSLARVNKPGFLDRYFIRRIVRKVLTKEGLTGKIEPTYQALLATGRTLTQDDLTAALAETAADKTIVVAAAEYGVA